MTSQAVKFPVSRSRQQRKRGASDAAHTPLVIRTGGMTIPDELGAQIRKQLSVKLGKFATRIERLTVRFEDVNGPRGGVDIACRAKAVLDGVPSVMTRAHAETPRLAFTRAATALIRATRKALERAGQTARKRSKAEDAALAASDVPEPTGAADSGSLIGRRVGRSAKNLASALERPEKQRRDALVDTAARGVSATDRKAGGGATARRNANAGRSKATATLEDSQRSRPSRKSTRKSANRMRSSTNLQQRATARTTSSTARARASRTRGATKLS